MKKVLGLLLAICIGFTVSACSGQAGKSSLPAESSPQASASEQQDATQDAPAGDKKEINVGFALNEQRFIFYSAMVDYAKKAAEEFGEENGVKFNWIVNSADTDTGLQASNVTDLINKGVDVLVLIPIDSVAIRYSIKEAHEAGIPVITTCRLENRDTQDEEEKAEVFVSLDAELQGYLPTKEVFDQMIAAGYKKEDIKCLEMVGNVNDEIAQARSIGFNKAVEEYGVTVVQSSVFEWNAEKALSLTSAAIMAHPEINMIFMAHDSNMPAIQQALERNNRWVETGEEGHVWIASCDGDKAGLDRLSNKTVDCIANYEHWAIAKRIVFAINELANGRELPQDKYLEVPRLLTQSNIATEINLWGKDFGTDAN
jgi:ribose transport system substrate-binding protein